MTTFQKKKEKKKKRLSLGKVSDPLFHVLLQSWKKTSKPPLPFYLSLFFNHFREEASGVVRGGRPAVAMEAGSASAAGDGHHHIRGVLTHGGRYVQYNVYGNLFEVSTKYVPPIRPIGRGAYGIVW